jgi:hypothetical protein
MALEPWLHGTEAPEMLDGGTVQSLYILHELGHVLGGFADDENNESLSMSFQEKYGSLF